MPLTKVKSGGVSDSITLTSPDINAPDIDGGTIDNAVIGGSTAAAGSFTTITATGGSSSNWNTAYGWGDHSTQSYATQTYVGTEVSNLVDSSPAALDTLNELAAALGDDPNFATTVTNSIALKAPLASPSFTGNVDTSGLLKVGTNDTEYANNYIRFKPTGAAYIDHNTVGQAINFRLSNASSLDKTAMTLTSAGNVGIGQSNPTSPNDATDFIHIGSATNQDTSIVLQDAVETWEIYQNDDLSFLFDTTNVMTLQRLTGNVGIGCSPSAKLHINGVDDAGATDLIRLQFDNSPADTGITFTDLDQTVKNRISMDAANTNNMRLSASTAFEVYTGTTGSQANNLRLQINSAGDLIKAGGVIKGERGTASAPAYSFSDDTDTGMFNIANADLGFAVGGSERMRIHNVGFVTTPYQPTWGASSLSNTSASGGTTSAGTLVFSGVLNNNGNHYSNSTGLFTAPVAGQYFVTFSGLYDDSYSVTGAVYIRRNTSNLYRGYHQNSGSSYLQISMSGVVECSVGDTISIYSAIAGWHIGGETSFSGFLIG